MYFCPIRAQRFQDKPFFLLKAPCSIEKCLLTVLFTFLGCPVGKNSAFSRGYPIVKRIPGLGGYWLNFILRKTSSVCSVVEREGRGKLLFYAKRSFPFSSLLEKNKINATLISNNTRDFTL